jgi:drug/metabolite transporter (DMT)-like permease
MVVGILAVSTSSIFIRYAQEDATSIVVAAGRLTIASLLLAPIALLQYRHELRALTRKQWLLTLISGVILAIHFATWITSLEYTTVASSVVLVTTNPLWVALLSPLFLKEKITSMILLGIGLALMGGVIIGLSDACAVEQRSLVCPPASEFLSGRAFIGDVLALMGAFAAAGYMMIGRRVRARMSLVSYTFVVYSVAAIVLLVWMLVTGNRLVGHPPRFFFWLLMLAIVPQLLGHSSFNWALKYLSAAYVSVSFLGESIGTIILAYILLNEMPGGIKLIGAILILTGIGVASRSEYIAMRRKSRQLLIE